MKLNYTTWKLQIIILFKSISPLAARQRIISFLIISTFSMCFCLFFYTSYFPLGQRTGKVTFSGNLSSTGESVVCNFPKLAAMSTEISDFIRDPPYIDCIAKYPLKFRTNFRNQIVPLPETKHGRNNETCCYKTVTRERENDNNIRYSKKCYPVSLKTPTIIPPTHEFIFLKCTAPSSNQTRTNKKLTTETYKDMFAFVHLKPEVEARATKDERMNILILGMDAQSRLNFIRQMPKTHAFLQNLSAIQLKGYTKVGDNTFPNVIPLLTGLTVEQLRSKCWYSPASYFDKCPFIWKDFSQAGYCTSFSEDSVWMGTFNYEKKGFLLPPTYYYLHPLTLLMAKKIGHESWGNAKMCYGPRLAFEVLLDYVIKTAIAFGDSKIPYFQYVWSNSLFHDFLNFPKLGDELLSMTLDFLKGRGYLENTLLVLISDHGMRWGSIRSTYQGRIEERMPLALFAFPPRFKEKYVKEMEILKENAENRLTTPFDFHSTLLHILDLETGGGQKGQGQGGNTRGISLLRNIPQYRTCPDAGIDEHWCVCNSLLPVPKNSRVVTSAAKFVLSYINKFLEERVPELCAKLLLRSVTEAVTKDLIASSNNGTLTLKHLQVTVITVPGDAIFEATVKKEEEENENGWSISGEISRLNLYRDQSLCVGKDPSAQKYCYCN